MDAIQLHSSSDQSISPYKQKNIRNPRKNNVPLISRPSDQNFAPPIIHGGGLLYTPQPSLSYSYPPFSYLGTQQQQQQQPPLLPLPVTNPYNNNNNCRTRGISCPPINRKINNRSKHQSLTPKKSKPSITSPQKRTESVKVSGFRHYPTVSGSVECNGESKLGRSKSIANSTKASSKGLMIESTNRLGPDPNDFPRVVSKVLSSSSSSGNNKSSDSNINSNGLAPTEDDEVVKFSGSVMFTLSPPPSSLPLPTFSLRPKLSCKAEAAATEIEIDAGATDSLRRLLRLR